MTSNMMNRLELDIVRSVMKRELSISESARQLGVSLPWTVQCVRRLERLGILQTKKTGRTVRFGIGSTPVARDLALLLEEGTQIDPHKVLMDSSLAILPWMLAPGSTREELLKKTSLTTRTIGDRIKAWRGMGLVLFEKGSKTYTLNPDHDQLIRFVSSYCEAVNGLVLKESHPDGVIVWQNRLEFMFSLDRRIDDSRFPAAGLTRLDELGIELVHGREYYAHRPGRENVGMEEAFIQAIRADALNTRIDGLMRRGLAGKRIGANELTVFVKKYGITERLSRAGFEKKKNR